MRKILLLAGLLLLVSPFAEAQTKMSGVLLCAPLNPVHTLNIGDHPGHAYAVAQGTCTWTQPWEIAGIKNANGVGTQLHEINGDTTKVHGTYVDTMANGDKAFYAFSFTLVTKAGVSQVMNHKWQLVGGTGKLKGAKGQGICTATPAGPDGSTNYACSGEYTSPK